MVRLGTRRTWPPDVYYHALTLSWPGFLAAWVAIYLAANAGFALLYLAQPGALDHARPGSFADAFFFSVQTLSTVGYGGIAPATLYGNIVMTAEAVAGLAVIALSTGLVFARVSVPRARVLFSRVAVVARRDGVPTLMVRLANERRNQIVQAEVAFAVLRNVRTAEGESMRRFYDLHLARARTPVFALTFTVMHALDADSPLHGATPDSLRAEEAELVVTVTGLDETMSQVVHARASYLADEIRFGERFADILGVTADGRRSIDYARFHDTVPA